jgi:hypothetical protein
LLTSLASLSIFIALFVSFFPYLPSVSFIYSIISCSSYLFLQCLHTSFTPSSFLLFLIFLSFLPYIFCPHPTHFFVIHYFLSLSFFLYIQPLICFLSSFTCFIYSFLHSLLTLFSCSICKSRVYFFILVPCNPSSFRHECFHFLGSRHIISPVYAVYSPLTLNEKHKHKYVSALTSVSTHRTLCINTTY